MPGNVLLLRHRLCGVGVGMMQFQPSEFLKPLYVVATAWLLSLKQHDRTLPVVPISFLATGLIAACLMKQPDFGQTVIFLLMWPALLTLSCCASASASSRAVSPELRTLYGEAQKFKRLRGRVE